MATWNLGNHLETSLNNYPLTPRNIPEERRAHLYRDQYQHRPRAQLVLLYKARQCNGTQGTALCTGKQWVSPVACLLPYQMAEGHYCQRKLQKLPKCGTTGQLSVRRRNESTPNKVGCRAPQGYARRLSVSQ